MCGVENLPLFAKVHLHCGSRRRPRDEEGREGSALLGWGDDLLRSWEDSRFRGTVSGGNWEEFGSGELNGVCGVGSGVWVVDGVGVKGVCSLKK